MCMRGLVLWVLDVFLPLSVLVVLIPVLRLEAVPKNLGVRDNLLEKVRVRDDRLVYFVQLAFVTQHRQEFLVASREFVDVLPPAVIRGKLGSRDVSFMFSVR